MANEVSRLQQLREQAGMSKEALAVKAGISYQYVTALERKERSTPNVVIAQRIAAALGVLVGDIWPSDVPGNGRSAS